MTGSDNNDFYITKRSVARAGSSAESELRSGARGCVVGETVRKKLFVPARTRWERSFVPEAFCEVIGILGRRARHVGLGPGDVVVIPIRTLQRRYGIQVISLSGLVQDGASTDKARQDISKLMRERRHLAPSDDDNFNVMDMKEIATMLTSTTQLLTALLSAVAAVSLLVGGIGIMNIMLVSVTERTREIGVRLAIGALEREVLTQFLVEAVVLSSLGGIIGIIWRLSRRCVAGWCPARSLRFQRPHHISYPSSSRAAVGMTSATFPPSKRPASTHRGPEARVRTVSGLMFQVSGRKGRFELRVAG